MNLRRLLYSYFLYGAGINLVCYFTLNLLPIFNFVFGRILLSAHKRFTDVRYLLAILPNVSPLRTL